MTESIHEEIKTIKKSLRLSMNGVVSTLQRRQGLDYKINFGVEIPRLKGIASQHAASKELASALWQENIRECRMLAIFLMPEEGYANIAESWIAESRFTEIADHLAMNILCKLPDAKERATTWIGMNDAMFRYCGYLTLSHLFRNCTGLDSENEKKFFGHTARLFNAGESGIEHRCALNALLRYMENESNKGRDLSAYAESFPASLQEYIGNTGI